MTGSAAQSADTRLTGFNWEERTAAPLSRLCDTHTHYRGNEDHLQNLLEVTRKYNVNRLFINCPLNDLGAVNVFEKYEKIGERIIPFYHLDMRENNPDIVTRAFDAGFWGLKCISPTHAYDDPFYDPVFSRAQALGMPLLCHTGLLSKSAETTNAGSGMSLMRADMMDTLATRYPELLIQGAHIGTPNIMEALLTCVYSPNLMWDASGGCRHLLIRNPLLMSAAMEHNPGIWNHLTWATDTTQGVFEPKYADGWKTQYEYQIAFWQRILSKMDPRPDTGQLDAFFFKNAETWVDRIRKKRKA